MYYGLGSPQGDRSGVILLPGFLGSDVLLAEMYAWLHRLNYRPYFSGIGVNADCPNLILRRSPFFRAVTDRARVTLHSGARPRTLLNRNLLVRRYAFVNGVKTGHTQQAGYVLIGSATRHGVTGKNCNPLIETPVKLAV